MLKPEQVTLRRRVGDDRDSEVTYGRRRRITRKLKSYDVIGPDGQHLGIIAEEMMTFEQRTPGRMYVNSRWESPRWFCFVGQDRWQRRGVDYITRKWALESLLNDIAAKQKEAAR